jgi:thymidylate kinase
MTTEARHRTPTDRAGVLISVIGIGGAGKSSGAKAAAERLALDGYRVTTFHARSEFASYADTALKESYEPLAVDEKIILTAFERVRELRYELEPIRRGFDVVLADRYWHCLMARAYADGVTARTLKVVSGLGELAPRPEAILWLDVEVATALERIEARGMWRANVAYGERLREGYGRLTAEYAIERVDASAQPGMVRDRIVDQVQRALNAVGHQRSSR